MKRLILLLTIIWAYTLTTPVKAQVHTLEHLGFDTKVVTLSKGKYQEFHDLKAVVEIGSILFNTETKEIIGFLDSDSIMFDFLKPHIISRWVSPDPLAEEFSSWSPYNYAMNNPIVFIDPDGRAATRYEDEQGNTLLDTNDGSSAVVTVTDDKRKGFDASVKGTKNTDDVVWNNTMKNTLLGFELSGKQEGLLNSMNSDWSRKAAIKYWQTGDAGAGIGFAFKESLSQWTNPELVVMGLSAGVAGYASLSNTKNLATTSHGSQRIAGSSATRGGVLSREGINATKTMGKSFSQADGATVYLHQVSPGRFNAVVEGEKGLITTMNNWSQKSINRIAKNYGWKFE